MPRELARGPREGFRARENRSGVLSSTSCALAARGAVRGTKASIMTSQTVWSRMGSPSVDVGTWAESKSAPSLVQPNAGGEPRQQPQRGTSEGCWRRLQRDVRPGSYEGRPHFVPVPPEGMHALATQEALLCLGLSRALRPMPYCHHPHGRLLETVKETIGSHNDLAIWQLRKLGDHTA
jgi:hypothetical protein